jgi:hypothetical protein
MTSLATKLSEVMAAVSHIEKRGRNTQQNYDYVTDADVLDTIRTALSKRGVATVVSVTDVENTPFITGKGNPMFLVTVRGFISFIDGESGEREQAFFVGAGSDSTDKGCFKAITGAVKYGLLKTFLVPTGDYPERDTNDDRAPVAPPRAARAPSGAAASGAPADSVKVGLSDAQRKMLKARMTAAGLRGPQQVAFLFQTIGKGSTTQMSSADMDKVLAALEDAEQVQRALDDVSEEPVK